MILTILLDIFLNYEEFRRVEHFVKCFILSKTFKDEN